MRKHFPLDVSFVKEAVWDGVDDKTRKVLSVVEEVVRREEGGEILSRRRDGEVVPKYRVGEVVTCDKEDWMGVVVGWEFEFDQKNRGESRVERRSENGADSSSFADAIEVGPAPDDSEEVDKKQPHYLVVRPISPSCRLLRSTMSLPRRSLLRDPPTLDTLPTITSPSLSSPSRFAKHPKNFSPSPRLIRSANTSPPGFASKEREDLNSKGTKR